MRAVTWHGKRDVRVDTVPDPRIEAPTDVLVRVTSTGICGSDLHLYEVLGPFLSGRHPRARADGRRRGGGDRGQRAGAGRPGRRAVQRLLRHLLDVRAGLHSQCETTQVHAHGKGAALFGYTKLYGQVPGGQAEYLRVPFGDTLPIKVPDGPPDDRFVYLSDVLPTAWQAVRYAAVPAGGSLAVLGLGPIGDMCTRVARHRGIENVIGIDLVPERLERVRARGVTVLDMTRHGRDLADNFVASPPGAARTR